MKAIKKALLGVVFYLFLAAILFPQTILAKESAKFSSEITVNRSASLTIVEKIIYTTDVPHHGIYRYIPTKPTEQVKLISITDDKGRPYEYKKTTENGNVTLRIGDPDHTFTGSKTYIIRYKVNYPIHKVKDHLELYWDITGEGWKFPLLNVKATIHSPVPILKYTCYSGKVGGNDKLCRVRKLNSKTLLVTYPQPITWNKNLTVAVAFPLNSGIQPPSGLFFTFQKILYIFLFIFPTLLFVIYWYLKGRDYLPDASGKLKGLFQHLTTPITAYEPPEDLTPGQVGLLIDEKVDPQDLVAEIIELARRGYLKIEKKTIKRFLGHKTEYIFHKLKDADDKLAPYQKTLLKGMFKNRDSTKLSTLKGSFYTTFLRANDQLYKSTTSKYFSRNPKKDKALGYGLSIGIVFWQIFVLVSLSQSFYLSSATTVGLGFLLIIVTGIIDFLFVGQNLPQKTSLGTKDYLFIKGLKENLKRGAWREAIKEKHLFLEEIIPYAIALGTIKQLAKDMKDLDLQPPDYLNSFVAWNTFDSFTSDLNSFAKAASSSISYNPKSGVSGGSGFSGGFSGGGGGGGGGGSW